MHRILRLRCLGRHLLELLHRSGLELVGVVRHEAPADGLHADARSGRWMVLSRVHSVPRMVHGRSSSAEKIKGSCPAAVFRGGEFYSANDLRFAELLATGGSKIH